MGENYKTLPIVQKLSKGEETVWVNPKKIPFAENRQGISMADIDEAEARLQRFAVYHEMFPRDGKRRRYD